MVECIKKEEALDNNDPLSALFKAKSAAPTHLQRSKSKIQPKDSPSRQQSVITNEKAPETNFTNAADPSASVKSKKSKDNENIFTSMGSNRKKQGMFNKMAKLN